MPVGSPKTQAHLARWWRWYGLAGGLGLVVIMSVAVFADAAWPGSLGGLPLLLLFYALWGWRITHPPEERLPE